MTTVQRLHRCLDERFTTAVPLVDTACVDLARAVIETDGATRSRQSACASSMMSQVQLRDFALDRIKQGLCVFDGQQRLLLFNRLYAVMYGLEPGQLRIGMSLRDVVDLRHAAGTGPDMAPEEYAVWRDRIGTSDQVVNTEVTLCDGRVHAIHHEPTSAGGWVATFEDITERRRAEAQVRYMAHHDALTSLPNRTLFTLHLERALARMRGESSLEDHRAHPAAQDRLVAVLFIDLDRFKDVNDTLGHAAGDELLRLVSERVGHCLRGGDTLARLGGDEFAILLDDRITTGEQAAEVARRVIGSVSAPYVLDGHDARVGTSVGISLCARDDGNLVPAMLLRQADTALYQAKAQGEALIAYFRVRRMQRRTKTSECCPNCRGGRSAEPSLLRASMSRLRLACRSGTASFDYSQSVVRSAPIRSQRR